MAVKFKDITLAGPRLFKRLNWPGRIAFLLVAIAVFSFIAIEVTGQPGFCNSCHVMNVYYDSWETSTHSEVNCLKCHIQPGIWNYAIGKINGLAQAVDCMVGRVGTKPNGTVEDASCLRSHCHDGAALQDDQVDYNGVKFTHGKHIGKDVDGLVIACGTCHSHFEGEEHFSVNNDVCFTCHFLKSKDSGQRLVETSCRNCHEVPTKTIERGLVKINHAEFVSYNASCESSCHSREIRMTSEVADNVCLNCHSERMGEDADSKELHKAHSGGEKIECFACHGEIEHGQVEVTSVSAMMDCQNCHSDTHRAQRSIYSTEHPAEQDHPSRVLSAMFMTHVECVGCHIEKVTKSNGAVDSFGTVAKAVPRACDNCHEAGTGNIYVPSWQKQIHALYDRINGSLGLLELRATEVSDSQLADRLKSAAAEARSILNSVEADGSWGVHNFKYTEAILLKAEKIVREAK